MMVIAIG